MSAALDADRLLENDLEDALWEHVTSVVHPATLELLDRRRGKASVQRRGWLVRRALAVADVLGLAFAFLLAQALLGAGAGSVDRFDARLETLLFLLTLPAWVVVAKLYGLYDRDEERTDHSTADDVVGVFHMVTVGAWLFVVASWATGLADPEMKKLLGFWLLAVCVVTGGRVFARALCRRHIAYLQNTVIVGAGDTGQTIARKLLKHPEYGLNLVGFVDHQPRERRADLEHLTLLGPPERLPELIRLLDVERVIVAFSNEPARKTLELVRSLQELDIQVDLVPRLYELVSPGVGLHTVEGVPLLGLPPNRLSTSSALLKRGLDLVLTALALVLLSPLLLAIALAIKLDSPGPVFFRQVRMGTGGRPFRIFKFRSMVVDAEERKQELAHLNVHAREGGDARMYKIDGDPRVTRVGAILRRYCLDELPQLLNVLSGDMSLVGPRPLIPAEDCEVRAWGRRRLDVKPGMTGLWQVLGSSSISFGEMVTLDYLYLTSWSLWNDCRLIAKTIPLVARGAGGRF